MEHFGVTWGSKHEGAVQTSFLLFKCTFVLYATKAVNLLRCCDDGELRCQSDHCLRNFLLLVTTPCREEFAFEEYTEIYEVETSSAMAQNVYDTENFFNNYIQLPRQVRGLDGTPEWPTLESLIPNPKGLTIPGSWLRLWLGMSLGSRKWCRFCSWSRCLRKHAF